MLYLHEMTVAAFILNKKRYN